MKRTIALLFLLCLISAWAISQPPNDAAVVAPVQSAVVPVTAEQGRDVIQSLINQGVGHIHLASGEYLIQKPIFIQGIDRFRMTADTGAILKHSITGSTQPIIYVICPDTTISGVTFDFNRTEWIDYKHGIKTQIPEWYAGKDGHVGPLEVRKFNLELTGNVVIDSAHRRKNPAAGDRGDNWWLVLKDSFDNFNLNVDGNRIKAPDLEMTGGPQFFINTRFNNNVIRGGKNAGGFISCLTKGQQNRRISNLIITNNLCQELNNYWISIGYDSTDSSESIDFDNVLIAGNRAIYGEFPAKFCTGILLKYSKYTGVTQIFDNTFDGRDVSPKLTKDNFAPRSIGAKNSGVDVDNPSGYIYYDEPRILKSEESAWDVSIPGTGRDRFKVFLKM